MKDLKNLCQICGKKKNKKIEKQRFTNKELSDLENMLKYVIFNKDVEKIKQYFKENPRMKSKIILKKMSNKRSFDSFRKNSAKKN